MTKVEERRDVSVSFCIGDSVVCKGSKKEATVIGYEYVEGRGTRYILIVDGKDDRSYAYGFEIEGKQKERPIGFNFTRF